MSNNGVMVAGTIGGVASCLYSSIRLEDIVETIVLTTVGVIVSFSVSFLLKHLLKKKPRP